MSRQLIDGVARIERGRPGLTSRRSAVVLTAVTMALLPVQSAQAVIAPHGHHAVVAKAQPETVDQRIRSLHVALHITGDEEASWGHVADIMRHNDAVMREMKRDPALASASRRSAIDDLKIYEKFNQAHVNGLAELIPAFATLYSSMPASQQAVADTVFRKFAHDRQSRS